MIIGALFILTLDKPLIKTLWIILSQSEQLIYRVN